MKKITAIFLVFVMMFSTFAATSVVSFAEGADTSVVSETEEPGFFQQMGKFFDDIGKAIKNFFESIAMAFSDFFNSIFGIEDDNPENVPDKPVSEFKDDEILSLYNKAVVETNKTSPAGNSKMVFSGTPTGDGAIGTVLKVIMPVAESALQRNSKPTDFIPGYGELKVEDLKGIKVTDTGKTYIVEMEVKSQTDGSDADPEAGPVGRAIGTLGSIDGALEEMSMTVESGRETVSLTYDDVHIRAEIDKTTGLIVAGQWNYIVKVHIGEARCSFDFLTFDLKNFKTDINYCVVV